MYENENIIYGEPLGPRVKEVSPNTKNYSLLLTFDNGERRVFDAKSLLSMRVFRPLNNKDFFASVKVEYGTIIWPQDIDYCPDTLYSESIPVGTNDEVDSY